MRKNQKIGLLVIVILTCAAAALPIDPAAGDGALPQTTTLPAPAPPQQEDLLPLAGLLAAVAAAYALSATQEEPEPAPEDASLGRYQSMLDATRKKLADLESRVIGCRNRLIWARKKNPTSWEARSAAGVYDKLMGDIKETKESLSTLESWGSDLQSLEFRSDEIRFRGQTYYYEDGLVRRISADEASRRFEKSAKAAYDEFKSSMASLFAYLEKDVAAEGVDLVDYVLGELDSTQKAFMQRINSLRNEYLTEQGSLQGQWKKYYDRLCDDYVDPFRKESKDLAAELAEKAEKLAYDVLTPQSVKYDLALQEREELEDEKERLHDRKRRWSMRLRDRAKSASKQVTKELRSHYDSTIFEDLRAKVDAWREKALDDARRMKWQRTEAKAEVRCQEIDQRISSGRADFLSMTHQKTVAALTAAYYAPKKEAAAAPKKATSGIRVVQAKKRTPSVPSVPQTPETAPKEADQPQITRTSYPGVTTTTPTTKMSQPFDLWTWLTEQQDRSGSVGSDIFRAVGGNILGRGALDLLLGVYVKDDGSVTTTRLDTFLNLTVIAGPILRGTAIGAKLCGWVGKTVAGAAKAVGMLKFSKRLTKVISYADDAAKYLLKQSALAKTGLEYAKSMYSKASRLLGLSVPAVKGKLDDMIKLADGVGGVTSKVRSKVTSVLSGLRDGAVKLEKTAETLTKPHGFDELLGKFSSNRSLTKYFSDLGKARGIKALYGGLNASYTRTGLSGLVKATVGRPFDALMDAGRIIAGRVPKVLKAKVGKLLSRIGFSSAEQAKAADVLKGFDDAATARSAAYGNEAMDAAESLVQQADELYHQIESQAKDIFQPQKTAVN